MATPLFIIGISGHLGSGKDYTATHLIPRAFEAHTDFRIIALADQIKCEIAARHPDQSYDSLFVHRTEATRRLLQEYGTENGRQKFGENVWVRAVALKIDMELTRRTVTSAGRPLVIIITDVRFPNEIDFVYSRGGIVLRIVAPARSEARWHEEGANPAALTHPSETALDDYEFKYIIHNNPGENAQAEVTAVISALVGVAPREGAGAV